MQPHIKLLKIIDAKSVKRRKVLMVKYKEDKLLGQLIELMASPEYQHDYNLPIPTLRPKPTTPTHKTFIKFRSLLYKQSDKLEEHLETLDSATKYVYTHIANQTYLGVEFSFVAATFSLFNRFNRNEHYIDFGFPELPCYIQVLPNKRQMINIKVDGMITATYLDGRYYKDIDAKILEQFQQLYLSGDFTGYISDDIFYITNYYPTTSLLLSKRLLLLEVALTQRPQDNIQLLTAFKIHRTEDINQFLTKDSMIICKQDTLPIFGKSQNMIALDCNKYIKLREIKDE